MFYKALLKKKNNKKAFTLIELIVVIAIIGVLVAILVPVMGNFVGNAQSATAKANARTIYGVAQAQAQFMVAQGSSVAASSYDSTAANPGPFMSQVKAMVTGSAAASGYYVIVVASGNVVSSVSYYASAGASAITYP